MTKALTKPCQGNTQRSPTLLQLFNTQPKGTPETQGTGSQEAHTADHETQPPRATATSTDDLLPAMSPPAPKKLRFSTDTPPSATAQQAMSHSPEQAEDEDDGEGDPVINVDFF